LRVSKALPGVINHPAPSSKVTSTPSFPIGGILSGNIQFLIGSGAVHSHVRFHALNSHLSFQFVSLTGEVTSQIFHIYLSLVHNSNQAMKEQILFAELFCASEISVTYNLQVVHD
jgi:uncharacterized membrane protein